MLNFLAIHGGQGSQSTVMSSMDSQLSSAVLFLYYFDYTLFVWLNVTSSTKQVMAE